MEAGAEPGEGAQGQGPQQPRDGREEVAKETGAGGGGAVGDLGEEAAGGTEVWALRLTKPAEGAALRLPVLRAPPREPRSPAAPSGSPAPPPLREATWTCRFGPSAKSRLQGCGSPPPRPGYPAPLRPTIGGSQCAGRRWSMLQSQEAGGAGTRLGGRGEGRSLFGASGQASGRDWDCGAGGLQGRSPPGGGRSRSTSQGEARRKARVTSHRHSEKFFAGGAGRVGSGSAAARRRGTRAGKFSKPRRPASQPRLPGEVTGPAAQLTSSSRGPVEGKEPQGWSLN